MSHIKQLAGHTAIYGLSTILGRLLNYLLVPLYTRMLDPVEYGSVSEFYAYASFLAVVFTYGMETAFFRFAQREENKTGVFSTAWISIIVSSIALSGLLILFTPQLAAFSYNTAHRKFFYYFIAILAADAITSIPFAWLRQTNRPIRFAAIKLTNIGLNISLNLFFLLLVPYLSSTGISWATDIKNAASGVTYIFIINIISSVCILPFFTTEFKYLSQGFNKKLWQQMITYAMPLMVLGFAGMVNETMDRFLLKYMIPDKNYALAQIGIYGAVYKLSIIITLFIQAFRFAAEPFFFSKAKDKSAPELYAKVMHYFIMVCCIIFLMVTLYLDFFKHFIGEQYRVGLPVVPILLLANMFLGIFFNLSIWYKLTDKTIFGAIITIIGALITIILNIILIPIMSYTGSAWATLVCYFSIAVISYFVGQKYFPVPYSLRKIGMYIGLALAFFFIYSFLHDMYSLKQLSFTMLQTAATFMFLGYIGWLYIAERKNLQMKV
jgi:O-antigen/teichoic acid export membrane protein